MMHPCLRLLQHKIIAALVACLLGAALFIPLPNALAANVIYVAPTDTGSASGANWANAATLQTALASAAAGDQIWVKTGTYTPGASRTDSFALKSGVAIYGGFAGGESTRGQRNPAANITILSGDIGTPGDSSDNSYHVVTADGVDPRALLDGFTIEAGNANSVEVDYLPNSYGGGILLHQSSPTIHDCTLRDNAADTGGGIFAWGGAPTFSNLVVEGNHATYGGGMSFGNAILSFAIFRRNSADYGAALDIEGANLQLSELIFTGNAATYWGGGVLTYAANPTIRQATFAGNSAGTAGGAVASGEGSPVIRNSVLWGNGPSPLGVSTNSAPDVQYSIVEGGYGGVGNRNLDPLFVAAAGADGIPGTADDDLHVPAGSPAIDVGNNAEIPADLTDADGDGNSAEALPFDFDRRARVAGGSVDIGAYEYTPLASTPTSTPTQTITRTPTRTPAITPPIDSYLPLITRP